MLEGSDWALEVTATVFCSLTSVSQGRSKPSLCARRGLGVVFIFQMMLQDEQQSPAPVPLGGAGPARGVPPGKSASRVLQTVSNTSVGLGIFLFCVFLLVWFWFFAGFGFLTLFCQRTEREGSISAGAPVMCNWGSHEGRRLLHGKWFASRRAVCPLPASDQGQTHSAPISPLGPLTRAPTRPPPVGEGQGLSLSPAAGSRRFSRGRAPRALPPPPVLGAGRSPVPVLAVGLPAGGRAQRGRLGGRVGVRAENGQRPRSCPFHSRGASPCSPGRRTGLLGARAAA